jgi:hypothetical protein
VDPKRNNWKKWRAKEEERHKRSLTQKYHFFLQVKSAVSSIVGGGKTSSHGVGHGSGHGLGHGVQSAVSHKSGGNQKLLKKVGKYAVVGLAGKFSLNCAQSSQFFFHRGKA